MGTLEYYGAISGGDGLNMFELPTHPHTHTHIHTYFKMAMAHNQGGNAFAESAVGIL